MITGFVSRWDEEKHFFPPVFARAMAFVQRRDILNVAPGRYELEGDAVFATVARVTTEVATSRLFEIHERYLDIQVLLAGGEAHGYYPGPPSLLPGLAPVKDEMAERDLAFYEHPRQARFFTLEPLQYAVYLPEELHCPCCAAPDPAEILKVVLKIRKDAL